MKHLLILFAFGFSIQAHATQNEITSVIQDPHYPGTQYAMVQYMGSDDPGICKVLGYESMVHGSIVMSPSGGNALSINRHGKIKEFYKNTNYIKEIICINYKESFKGLVALQDVESPLHPSSKIPLGYSDSAQEKGVCRVLGFKNAVLNSAYTGPATRSLLLDAKGKILQAANFYVLNKVICIGENSSYQPTHIAGEHL